MYDDYSYEAAMAAIPFEYDSEPEEWPDDLWDDGPEDPWRDEDSTPPTKNFNFFRKTS